MKTGNIAYTSDIAEVFNKLEEELSKLYESSMISRAEKTKDEREVKSKKADFIIGGLQNKWVTMLSTQ